MISVTDLTQKQWIKACEKLGLQVDTKSGKGSHVRVSKRDDSSAVTTIPYHTHKFMSLGIYRTLLEWGFSEQEIDKALK